MEKIASILLVEDQPDLLDNLSLTLEMAGYQTVKARMTRQEVFYQVKQRATLNSALYWCRKRSHLVDDG